MTNYDEYDTYWQNGGYKKISDVIFAEWHFFIFLFFGNTINVFIFLEKWHKIVENFALLTTELLSYKMCKVGMLFCIV